MDISQIKKRLTLWNLLFFGLGVLVLIFLLIQINFKDLLDLLIKIKVEYLLLGAVLYLCKGLIRAFRFKKIIRQNQSSFFKMLRLTFASSLASQVLPLKLGELTYVYLLKKDNRAPVSQGLSSLLVVRLLDLLAVSLIFILVTLTVPITGTLVIYFRSILGFMALLLVAILVLLFISGIDEKVIQFLNGFSIVRKFSILGKIVNWLSSFLLELKQYRWHQYLGWTGLACAEWLVNFAVFHALMLGFGFTPSYLDTVTAVTFSVLASVLPINSMGNFGTQEVGWTAGLTLLGYTKEAAISSGFATHLITLGYFLVYGGLSWISYLFNPGDARRDKQETV